MECVYNACWQSKKMERVYFWVILDIGIVLFFFQMDRMIGTYIESKYIYRLKDWT